jgi:hypothetical protein
MCIVTVTIAGLMMMMLMTITMSMTIIANADKNAPVYGNDDKHTSRQPANSRDSGQPDGSRRHLRAGACAAMGRKGHDQGGHVERGTQGLWTNLRGGDVLG